MNLFVILVGLTGFCVVMWDFSKRLPPEQAPPLRRWFKNWALKGLLTPFLLWLFFNSGLSVRLPPLIPDLDFARANGTLGPEMLHVATLGLFVISTFWTAITTGWLLAIVTRQAADSTQVLHVMATWTIVLGPVTIFLTWAAGWRFGGLAATLWLLPTLQHVLSLHCEPKPAPIYSRAIAAINFDKYEEAEQAVIQELESCEDDFNGWMMLAELYATKFHDLAAAQDLLRQTCEHPNTTCSQFAVACHRLADWRLRLADDPDGARAALQEICRRYPGSHLDRMASLRIEQLPASREVWIASQGAKKIHLHKLDSPAANSMAAQRPQLSREEAFAHSQRCVERLQENPNDVATREELARLWAQDMEQIEMGAEQLELLLSMRGIAPGKAAEWLGLLASWHLRFPQNLVAARLALERLVRLYPKSPQALAAQRRLNLLDLEEKMRQAVNTRYAHHA